MTTRFDTRETALRGLVVLTKRRIADGRGYLERMYCFEELAPFLGDRRIEQINRTFTLRQGTVRGLHYQRPPYAETKIVSCLRGAVFDVAVDLRAGSPTFLHWHGELLSGDNGAVLIIPEGFAHGFQTLEPDCEMAYFHTARYVASAEGGMNVRDPAIGIRWPAQIEELSDRDTALPNADATFTGLCP